MATIKIFRRRAAGLLVASALGLMAGCGDGLDRQTIKGEVTYKGQPLEWGSIIFEPTESVGAIAPTTVARIDNGRFETVPEESPIPGTYEVHVNGYDKAQQEANAARGVVGTPALFPEYILTVQIPPPDGVLKIDVPESSEVLPEPVTEPATN